MSRNNANSSINSTNKPPQAGSQDTPNVTAFIGTVTNIQPLTFQVDVSIDGGKSSITAIWVSALLSSLTGLTVKSFPQIGQQVLVLKSTNLDTGATWCMGYFAQADNTAEWMVSDNFLGIDENSSFPGTTDAMRERLGGEAKNTGHFPKDIVDGEASIATAHGTALDLLQNFARLRASDLAKIEAYTIDDFVRILSQNFEHLSAFGDYKILNNNGALDVIWRGTYAEHETFDKEQKFDDKNIPVKNGNSIILDEITEDNLKADARWRFHQYIGKLGNFIHTFITEPQKMIHKDGNIKSARAKIYTGLDGTYIVQSMSDIVFEKVIRIPIPVTNFKLLEELKMAELKLDAFQQWKYDKDSLYETSYQFIDYGRWLANYFSLAVFHGLPGDATVPSEAEVEKPKVDIKDKELTPYFSSLNPTWEQILKRYATIRIFKDGSILLVNGEGCAVHMAGMDMTFSSPRDINIKAAGSVNITGNDVNIIARKAIDIASALRGISIRAKTWFEMACEQGSILLQSFMPETKKNAESIDGVEDTTSNDKLAANYTAAEAEEVNINSGIILRTAYTNIVLDAGSKSILSNCRYYINSAVFACFSAIEFFINKIAYFTRRKITFGSPDVNVNTLYANSISNQTAIPVADTKQEGLTRKHEDDKVEYSDLNGENFLGNIDNTSANSIMDSVLGDEPRTFVANDFPSFEFRDAYNDDELTPKYEKHYQTVSDQLIDTYPKTKQTHVEDVWNSVLSLPHTGRPPYPPEDELKLGYKAVDKTFEPSGKQKHTPNPKSMINISKEYFTKPEAYETQSLID